MKIDSLDHLVLTVADIDRTSTFYEAVLGMEPRQAGGRHALHYGAQKINLHRHGHEFEPKAKHPVPGSADLCFITTLSIPAVMIHLARCEVPVEVGPVEREGASGPLLSVYIRDPDDNLIEIANLRT
ncbi:MAG TPA: VOC family protein [Lichenihabitans sp.]|jgi:catechol 2,3-dioxygenase-like lactoylglutathione lyase family enzyme|nr:VOC family protein [Lichenihabitans sp.]